jgi:hypothetical protein
VEGIYYYTKSQNGDKTDCNNYHGISLRVPEKRVLRRIFGLRRDEAMGGWRKLHDKELHDLCSLP